VALRAEFRWWGGEKDGPGPTVAALRRGLFDPESTSRPAVCEARALQSKISTLQSRTVVSDLAISYLSASLLSSPPDGWDFPQGGEANQDGMYTADMHFESKLLRDWTIRTLDPFEANLFYIPAWNYGATSNGGDPNVRSSDVRIISVD
jgi:hypothetical protein